MDVPSMLQRCSRVSIPSPSLPRQGVLLPHLLNIITHLTVAEGEEEEEDNDANKFAQLKLRKKFSRQHPTYSRICILQFRGMLATREMLPFATDEMHVGPLSTLPTRLPEATHPDSPGTLRLQLQLRQPSHSVVGILRRAETSRLRPRKPSGLPSGLCR